MPNNALILVIGETICTGIIGPVKTTNFIRTVIGTIPCTNTTVISHLVQTFTAMVGSGNRANVFAWRVIAMLAKHGLENSLNAIRIVGVTAEVTVDTQPCHIVKTQYLTFTYNRYIVFCCTGYHTGAATKTTVQIYTHAPFNTWLIVMRIRRTLFIKIF